MFSEKFQLIGRTARISRTVDYNDNLVGIIGKPFGHFETLKLLTSHMNLEKGITSNQKQYACNCFFQQVYLTILSASYYNVLSDQPSVVRE